ncbi:unnamed protein product [Thlaspi arvense]|uniref:RING-type domain-containing protein n=1 Tax=Thlaspi arvense TaxID=13288 RepID=A0AAU9RWQ9_THLAR|nr:unnamed protein product [Thlaspi arvense]
MIYQGYWIFMVILQSVTNITVQWQDKNVIEKPVVPTFYCLVCMGQLREETSTKCGHIFCRECIHSAIAVQGKCPTCWRIIGIKDTFRVYLPARDAGFFLGGFDLKQGRHFYN